MDLCVVSYGKEAKSKLSPAYAVTKTSFSQKQLLSITLPLQHKLSFKIRYGSNASDAEQGQWSGLIPLMSLEKPCNQTSWMVKSEFYAILIKLFFNTFCIIFLFLFSTLMPIVFLRT